ncbi:zinc metalloproteinase nas-13-like [Paramacrobiotus metropolitanus]|uniref:zinc metalloproteinase nas-13-like n=1 Tax=Paramacrobiotus metropolitanus TaxID=2943436 RepID=UPI002446202F|nr:zinc metalloproteinase nas-13-like [Paramacrobiotus metropolitanus]
MINKEFTTSFPGNEGIETLENDIIITNNSLVVTANGTIEAKNFVSAQLFHWPSHRIPVVIDPQAPYSRAQRALILDALRQYHLYTCIRFVPRTTENDYIFITHSPQRGCSSHVGRQGGKQTMYLKIPGCVTLIGTTIHEILHNIGFFHEHSRPDRDANVKIIWDDILPGYAANFQTYAPWTVDTLGQPYDYDSVMHYSAVAFSKNRASYTVYPFNARPDRLGQRLKLSEIDIRKVNVAYRCPAVQQNTLRDVGVDNITNLARKKTVVFVGTPAICNSGGRIDAVLWNDGELFLFKKGYYWIFKEAGLGRFVTSYVKPRSTVELSGPAVPKRFDAVVFFENNFYFFENGTTFVLPSLEPDMISDAAPTLQFFALPNITVKAVFEFDNQLYFSDGSTIYQYERTNDAILQRFHFTQQSGLPLHHDLIVNVADGRLLIFRGNQIYLTKRHMLLVENGFPRSFQSAFC